MLYGPTWIYIPVYRGSVRQLEVTNRDFKLAAVGRL